jgi:hypothetical protein
MGHSGMMLCEVTNLGAIKTSSTSDDTTSYKIVAFRKAGIRVLDHIGYIGEDMRVLMKEFKEKKKKDNLATKKVS